MKLFIIELTPDWLFKKVNKELKKIKKPEGGTLKDAHLIAIHYESLEVDYAEYKEKKSEKFDSIFVINLHSCAITDTSCTGFFSI